MKLVAPLLFCMTSFLAGCLGTADQARKDSARGYNDQYEDAYLSHVAFPMGGLGAGMMCLEGTGAISHVSLRHQPDLGNEPCLFSALCIKGEGGNVARVLEGPVPAWKIFGRGGAGFGLGGTSWGLPRFAHASFQTRFPFADISLEDQAMPVQVEITGWSPFIPLDADNSSLPVAGLEYRFINTSGRDIEAVYSFHTVNFMQQGNNKRGVKPLAGGFMLYNTAAPENPFEEGAFAAVVDHPSVKADCAWFRGGWFDPLTMVWKGIEEGSVIQKDEITEGDSSPGGSLAVPLRIQAGQEATVRLMLCWYVPQSNLRAGADLPEEEAKAPCCPAAGEATSCAAASKTFVPWYAGRFTDVQQLVNYWVSKYDSLRAESREFSDCFYDTTLPPEVVEAIAANLTILKSPTVLRQKNGFLWNWEGSGDGGGCCHGSCTHVWNYAQAIPHLFPDLERTLRQTEFFVSQDPAGHQNFRSSLPIRAPIHDFHAASDGQLGGIMKVYREWRISGDTEWLRTFWPKVKGSLDYCIATWDPDHTGVLMEPHHNTYDIEFWGPDGMCSSFYLGALKAAAAMGKSLGEPIPFYDELYAKGRRFLETELFNGEYFYQKIQWQGLHAGDPTTVQSFGSGYSPEAVEILKKEGPKYQYGTGCLSDGILGAWMAEVCGVGEVLDEQKVQSHLLSIHKYNLKKDLSSHANPQRPGFAMGDDGGLLICTWPRGGQPSLPFVYSNEVWTGIEYQAASHMMKEGLVAEGLDVVRACRDRYDGRIRNPFNEYECGNWYARAMSSYALLQGLTGARYDAVEKTLYLNPAIPGDFRSFLSTQTGYGTVGVKDGQPFVEVKNGRIDVQKIQFDKP